MKPLHAQAKELEKVEPAPGSATHDEGLEKLEAVQKDLSP